MTQRLVLLVGGRSTEHDASLHSYLSVLREVESSRERFGLDAVVYIRPGGGFRTFEAPPWPHDERALAAGRADSFAAVLRLFQQDGAFVFSLLHGNEGEDGAWQGVAEVLDIAGSFGPVLASAAAMDKNVQGMLAASLAPDLRLPDTWLIRSAADAARYRSVARDLAGRTAVVKPNRMGSSLLTSLVPEPTWSSLRQGAREIFPYDQQVLVQEYIPGREYTCGVLREHGNAVALPVIEARTADDFLGHREKHRPGDIEVVLHTHDDAATRQAKDVSRLLFEEMDMFGFARFDYRYRDSELYFLEVNTLPGLTAGSAFPRMLEASGRTIGDLICATVDEYHTRARRRRLWRYEIGH